MLGRKSKPKRAVVLGCGPAGLFAAWAFKRAGWEVQVFSKKRRSELYGAQYLLSPIPDLTAEAQPTEITFELKGSWEDSTRKVYGHSKPMLTWEEYLAPRRHGWDLRQSYYAAWGILFDDIHDSGTYESADMKDLVQSLQSREVGMVVSSLPAKTMCRGGHGFEAQGLWTIGDAPERGIFCPIPCPKNTVVVNGELQTGLSRVSNVFGYKTAEWPDRRKPPIPNLARVENPMATNCDCWPEIVRVGRFGVWSRSELSHNAYYRVANALGFDN